MNKFLVLSILLFVVGISSFYSAYDCYHSIQSLQEIPIIYGAQSNKLLRDSIADLSAQVKITATILTILGTLAWGLSLFLFIKRNKLSYK